MMISTNTNTASIQFLIVGGSIAGLSCAYSLRAAGHSVLVIDKSDLPRTHNGGIRIPPNMMRILQKLPGMYQIARQYGTTVSGMVFMKGQTPEVMAHMSFLPEIIEDLGSNFIMLPYNELYFHLLRLCKRIGVDVRHKIRVISVDTGPGKRPAVITSTGNRLTADILIGADGRHSIVRKVIQDSAVMYDEDDTSDDTDIGGAPSILKDLVSYGVIIPASAMLKDPDLKPLVESNAYMTWPGNLSLATGHRCGYDMYNLNLVRPMGEFIHDPDTDWISSNGPDLQSFADDFEPRIRKMINLSASCNTSRQTIQRLPKLSDATSRIIVIGDAANDITIHCTHNSSTAVEDGFAVGTLFSHITDVTQVPMFIDGYNQIRHGRANMVARSELEALLVITLPPGPARESRDDAFRSQSSGEMSDTRLRGAWGTYLYQFDYDAQEAVEQWWLNWGQYMQPCKGNITSR